MKNAPKNYLPHYIRLNAGGKDPVLGYSWKSPQGRLSISQAINWMANGGNIGLAGTPYDNLVDVDCDGGIIQENEIKPTLMDRTRSRVGRHAIYWNFEKEKIPNIPTDEAGEVRCQWEFVVIAGSYVPTDPMTVPENDRENAGYYTVCNAIPPNEITYAELPKVFREIYEKKKAAPIRKPSKFDPKQSTTECSALFEVTALDVCLHLGGNTNEGERWPSLFHNSDTGKNMSFSNNLLHCWRHRCSFNGLQALTVLSDYMTCLEAGTPHKGGVGSSQIIGDNEAIFKAWKYAKQQGYIPKTDKIPVRAMHYIAEKHLHFKPEKDKPLPTTIYKRVLQIVEKEY
jgi:putative DNA primase/helicase